MDLCNLSFKSLEDVEDSIQTILTESEDGDLEQNILDAISEIKDQYISPDDTPKSEIISNIIIEQAEAFGFPIENHPTFFTFNNIKNKIEYIEAGGKYKNSDATDQLVDSEVVTNQREANIQFLADSYGPAIKARDYAVMQHNIYLVDALFLQRGLLSDDTGTVTSTYKLNENIIRYQEKLFNNIKEYLLQDAEIDKETRTYLESNPTIYEYTNGKYTPTNHFKRVYEIADEFLKPQTKLSASAIQSLYNRFESGDKIAERKLTAYNSRVFLKHFDSYISNLLGKSIEIENGLRTGSLTKYRITSKNEMVGSFRDTDPSVEKETDNITKLILSIIPISYNQEKSPIINRYLKFQEYEHIIGKIKTLQINNKAARLIFNEDFQKSRTGKQVWDTLTQKTKDYIENKRFSEVISGIRIEDQLAMPALFELLANEKFQQNLGIITSKTFDQGELNLIWSIYNEIFNINNPNSVISAADSKHLTNYFQYINQLSNSIFQNNFIQIFQDIQGNRKIRLLTDTTTENIRRELGNTINEHLSSNFSKLSNATYAQAMSDYNIQPIENNTGIQFQFPNTNIKATVYFGSQETLLNDINGKPINTTNISEYFDRNLLKLTDQFTQLNLFDNSIFETAIKYVSSSESEVKHNLLSFTSRIIANQYANMMFIKPASNHIEMTKNIFGENQNDFIYNSILKQTTLISPKDKRFLRNIAKAKASIEGKTTAIQVNDSERASQSLQSFSRKIGSITSLWDLQERKNPEYVTNEFGDIITDSLRNPILATDNEGRVIYRGSASRHFSLLNNPDLFEGYYASHEYYNPGNKSKKVTDFTVAELVYNSVVQQFAPALYNDESDDFKFVNDGYAMFLASVNSDKNMIGYIRTDIRTKMPIYDNFGNKTGEKKYIDFTNQNHQNLIAYEFGKFYENMYLKIKDDFDAINNYISRTFKNKLKDRFNGFAYEFDHIPMFNYDDNYQLFKQWYLNMCNKYPNFKEAFPEEADLLLESVLDYNYSHRSKPIAIVDQVYINGRKLQRSNTLIAQLYTFKGKDWLSNNGIIIDEINNKYYNKQEFWKRQSAEVTRSLINSDFELNLLKPTNDNKLLLNYLNEKYTQTDESGNKFNPWVTKDSHLIYSKFHYLDKSGKLQTFNLSGKGDVSRLEIFTGQRINDLINDPTFGTFELNPIWEKYNYMDYFITQEWQNAGVGSFVGLPIKTSSNDALEQESSQFLAQHKRNVMWTAQMQQELINTLHGIPRRMNVATIQDIIGEGTVISGKNREINDYGGATFVSGFMNYLENYSLGGQSVGTVKKDFCNFKHEQLGIGGIIKTACYPSTNDNIRKSNFWHNIHKKSSNLVWLDENDNELTNLDITRNYLGELISFGETEDNRKLGPINTSIYYKDKNGNLFNMSLEKDENTPNGYFRKVIQVDPSDYHRPINDSILYADLENNYYNEPHTIIINNNYDLWRAFGGQWSMEPTSNNLSLIPSENSMKLVVKAMNEVGIVREGMENFIQDNKFLSQRELYQPLKHALIHWMPSQDSIKIGPANINKSSVYEDETPLNFQSIETLELGPQLDKEHHADNAEVSLMTQVMSAAVQTQYTTHLADRLQQGLRRITEIGLRNMIAPLEEAVNKKINNKTLLKQFSDEVTGMIIQSLSKPDSDSFAEQLAYSIEQKVKEGTSEFARELFPLSDNTIFHKAVSNFANYISKTAIKLKVKGILAVLNPSKGCIKLYGGKALDTMTNPVEELEQLQIEADNNPIYQIGQDIHNLSDLEFGRTYKIIYNESDGWIPGQSIRYKQGDTTFAGYNLKFVPFNSLQGELIKINGKEISIDNQLINQSFTTGSYLQEYRLSDKFRSAEDLLSFILHYNLVNNTFKSQYGEDDYSYEKRIINLALERTLGIKQDTQILIDPEILKFQLSNIHKKQAYETDSQYAQRLQYEIDRQLNNPEYFEYVHLNPDSYELLKNQAKKGTIKTITEYVKNGRDLGAYNIRFIGDKYNETGLKFQMWDIDSLRIKHKLVELDEAYKNAKTDEKKITAAIAQKAFLEQINYPNTDIKEALKFYNRQVQKDLECLSNNGIDKIKVLENILKDSNQSRKSKQLDLFAEEKLSEFDYLEYKQTVFNSIEEKIDFIYNSESLNDLVYIDGIPVAIHKDSIKIQPFELVMPKLWQTEFGFDEHTDLNTVQNDPDWFIKRFIKNKNNRDGLNESEYDIVFENISGKHIYILNSKNLDGSFEETDAQIVKNSDGKWYRQDFQGNIMYEVPEGTKIYTNYKQSTEILVFGDNQNQSFIDKVKLCLSSLPNDGINFSTRLIRDKSAIDILENLRQDNKYVANLLKSAETDLMNDFDETKPHLEQLHNKIINKFEQFNLLNENNYQQLLNENNPIIKLGRRKHTAFLKSLDVVAARIPAQAMQSFMAMKVVMYDNPNSNNAFVSDLQFFLQGSDLDIDAVTLCTYNFNKSGLLDLWSPYAQNESIQQLEESMNLPLPTGVEITEATESDLNTVANFFGKYKELFNFVENNENEVSISENFSNLTLLKEFLEETEIPIINSSDLQEFKLFFETDYQKSINNYNDVIKFTDAIKNIYNKHQLYLNNISKDFNKFFRIMNNYNQKQIYDIIVDPVNQVAAQISVDEVVNPIKEFAKTQKSIAKNNAKRTSGNSHGKLESINDTQEGKDCIAKSASSIKAFFAGYHASNQVLNFKGDRKLAEQIYNKLSDKQKQNTSVEEIIENQIIARQKILLKQRAIKSDRVAKNLQEKGIIKNNKFQFLMANIKAQDISTIKNEQVLDAILSIENDQDAISFLSALLGLSADNAKELILSKINAGVDMIGLYLYGIASGIDFNIISSAMTSFTGETLRKIVQGNIFKDGPKYYKLTSAFSYFTKDGLNKIINANPSGFVGFKEALKKTDIKTINDFFGKLNDRKVSRKELLDILEDARNNTSGINTPFTLQLIRDLENYTINYKDTDHDTLVFLKDLAFGAQEMQKLGQFILNKELPSTIENIIKKVTDLQYLFNDTLDNYIKYYEINGIDKIALNKLKYDIDITRLFMDENYMQEQIQKLDEYCHSINILEILNTDSNFKGYLKALTVTDAAFMDKSYRYRSLRELMPKVKKKSYSQNDDVIIKKLSNFIQKNLIYEWLWNSKKLFILPAGNHYFDPNTNQESDMPLDKPQIIRLGTDSGNNTFRMWMEKEVIPNLQKGNLGERFKGQGDVMSNKFIKKLTQSSRNNTALGNLTLLYSLGDVNMTPKKGSIDETTLRMYKDAYNELGQFDGYYVSDENGNLISYNLKDLFTLYTMFAHGWKSGNNSLFNIVANEQQQTGYRKEYFDFIATIDETDQSISNILNIEQQLIPWLAEKENPYSSDSEVIIVSDQEEGNLLAVKYRPSENDKQIDADLEAIGQRNPNIRGTYKILRQEKTKKLDPGYYETRSEHDITKVISDNRRFKVTIDDYNETMTGKLQCTFGSNKENTIQFIPNNGTAIDIPLSKLGKELPTKCKFNKTSGILERYPTVDMDKVAIFVKQYLDPKKSC